MEPNEKDRQQNDPALLPERGGTKELIGRQYTTQHQFEETVQKLREEFEKHPKPPTGIFY